MVLLQLEQRVTERAEVLDNCVHVVIHSYGPHQTVAFPLLICIFCVVLT